ncbi:DODA-type extradiol aromatic ring-opening family dioxygenase, partial [Pyxidicoccus fallax]
STQTLPTFFLSHGGGPCFWMDWGPVNPFDNLAAALRGLAGSIGARPRAVLVISGHWEEDVVTVQTNPRPPMLFDYYGFPEHTYRLSYPAPGSPELAARVKSLLGTHGFPVREDAERGYDHGVFVPFLLVYPEADIPVVQLSLKNNLDPEEHLAIGRALAPLRKEGVLIVGSGLSYHNLRNIPDRTGASEVFDRWLTEAVTDADPASRARKLIRWIEAPAARAAHPREDHLLPLMVASGAAEEEVGRIYFTETMKGWNLRSSSYQFGTLGA